MKPTTDEVLAWAFDAGFGGEYWNYAPAFEKLAALAYAAGVNAERDAIVDLVLSARLHYETQMEGADADDFTANEWAAGAMNALHMRIRAREALEYDE